MKYLMVLPVQFYRVDNHRFACESAFATHLRELLPRTAEWGNGILLCGPEMSSSTYNNNKSHLAVIDSRKEELYYQKAFNADISRIKYFLLAPFTVWPKIWKAVKQSRVIHSGPSNDPLCPFEIIALIMGTISKKKTIFVIDIDHRKSAWMDYQSGRISRKSYWLRKYLYDPLFSLQIIFAVRFCNLLLLKGQPLVDRFGKNKPHVKNFYDTAHNSSMVLSEAALASRINQVNRNNRNIKLVYFGRVVAYKGIRDMIIATHQLYDKLSKSKKKYSVSLCIIGSGDQKAELQQWVTDQNMGKFIEFKDAIPYGSKLFEHLQQYDFLLAAPKHEDTPRSVFDAMACALPIIAYDTYYYVDLEKTGTVKTVPWNSVVAMSEKIERLANEPDTVIEMMKQGREFATNNTQEAWIEKRQAWCREFL